MNRKHRIVGFLAMLALAVIGCGGSSAPTMTQTQAAAAFGDVYEAMAGASGSLDLARSAPVSPIREDEAAAIQKAILQGTRVSGSAAPLSRVLKVSPDTTTTIPAYTYTCPSGGNIVVTGSYSETTSGTTNSILANIVETINNCKDSGVTMNGDPNIETSIAESSNATSISSTITMTGGITVGSSSCSTDLQMTTSFNETTDSGTATYSGSFCGVALNGSVTI